MSGRVKRWYCSDCDAVSNDDEMLTAPHPFVSDDIVTGCPRCREVNTLQSACDFPGCNWPSSTGAPTPNGYALRCIAHPVAKDMSA